MLLTWAAPDPEPGRAPVTGYEIYLDEQARPVGVTGSLSYLYRGLVPGRTYVFHVRAVNRVGRSQPAGSVTVTVIEAPPLSPPGPPGSLRAELTPSNEAFLQWTAPPPVAGRAPVTGYVVYRELPRGDFEELGETESLSYTHPDLSPGERYVFTVRASSGAGLSDASASAFIDVPPVGTQIDIQAPAPPGDFTAVLTPNNDALLNWTAPVPSADRAPFTHFEIWHERSGMTGPRKVGESRSLSYIHPNLERGETHVFYVVAWSGGRMGGPSRSAAIDVPLEPTGILPPSAPGGFTEPPSSRRTTTCSSSGRNRSPPPIVLRCRAISSTK